MKDQVLDWEGTQWLMTTLVGMVDGSVPQSHTHTHTHVGMGVDWLWHVCVDPRKHGCCGGCWAVW